jgi:hypothetical protein
MATLEYRGDNGNPIRIRCIDTNGQKGQMVVLDKVNFKPDHTLSKYPQPAYFYIANVDYVEYRGRKHVEYRMQGEEGITVTVSEASACYFYDAIDHAKFCAGRDKEMIRRKDRKIANQATQLAVLKEVTTSQGVRIISDSQAKELGIEE